MSTLILTLNLTDHDHSPMAQRQIVGQLLDQAKGAIGSTDKCEGMITHSEAPFQQKVVGSWKFLKSSAR